MCAFGLGAEGVINPREEVTPVVDLRQKPGVTVAEQGNESRITDAAVAAWRRTPAMIVHWPLACGGSATRAKPWDSTMAMTLSLQTPGLNVPAAE